MTKLCLLFLGKTKANNCKAKTYHIIKSQMLSQLTNSIFHKDEAPAIRKTFTHIHIETHQQFKSNQN